MAYRPHRGPWTYHFRASHAELILAPDGKRDRARQLLRGIVKRHPDHPAADRARRMLERMKGGDAPDGLTSPRETPPSSPASAEPPSEPASESPPEDPQDRTLEEHLEETEPTGLARAELAVFQTLHGAGVGAEMCAFADCDSARSWALVSLLGAGAGLGLSLGLTLDGVYPGQAAAINAGTRWGLWNAVAIAGTTNLFDVDDSGAFRRRLTGALLAGQLAGLGAGLGLWYGFEPTAGDVSLATSTGWWSSILGVFVWGMTEFEGDARTLFPTFLALSDVGLLAGALLTRVSPMSRGRVLLIDLGGAVGAGVGMGLDVLIEGGDFSLEGFFGSATAGALVGLGLSYWLTRNWDVPDPPADVTVAPIRGGAMAQVRMSLR
jgi:hypothetical protein